MEDCIKDYYDNNVENEWKRLDNPYSRIEFISTMYMIKKYFPVAGKVLDIGCGPGRYSIELLKKGFNVTLMDLSSKSIYFAKAKIESLGFFADNYICGDANYLDAEEDNKYDCILLMGPMYHIQSKEMRVDILKQCKRILKNNGLILITYINSIGILKDKIAQFSQEFNNIDDIYRALDEESYLLNNNLWLTTPDIVIDEIKISGFKLVNYAGAESFLSGQWYSMTKYFLENKRIYINLLKAATSKCEDPRFRDGAEHLIVVAKKESL